jgi:hypothetical protein
MTTYWALSCIVGTYWILSQSRWLGECRGDIISLQSRHQLMRFTTLCVVLARRSFCPLTFAQILWSVRRQEAS